VGAEYADERAAGLGGLAMELAGGTGQCAVAKRALAGVCGQEGMDANGGELQE
jgi:hypothetical protein